MYVSNSTLLIEVELIASIRFPSCSPQWLDTTVTVYEPGSFISFTRFIITLITRYFPLYHYSASCVQPQTPLPFPVLTSLCQQLPGYVFNHVISPYAYVSTTWHFPF